MTKLARTITPDEVASYRNAGVVLLRGILDLSAVNTVRRCIDEAVETLDESASGYDMSELTSTFEASNDAKLAEKSTGQHNVSAILDYVRDSGETMLFDKTESETKGSYFIDTGISARLREFKRFALRGAAAEISGALLNSETVRFFGDQIFIKEPGTRERTAFHQDATYFEIEGNDCCVLWIPTDPVRLEHGAMRYIRGSHKDGNLYQPNIFVSQAPLPGSQGERLPDIEGNEDEYDIVNFDVEPGDVIVHHYRTIHGTGGNLSRYQVRRVASIRYCGDDIRFISRPGVPKQLHHTNTLRDGDPLSGQDFPVVWRAKKQEQAA